MPAADRGSRGGNESMDPSRPPRRCQREDALVPGAPSPSGRGVAGAGGRYPGTDRQSALGLSLRIRRFGSNVRRTHGHLRDGDHPGENALEQAEAVRDRRSSGGTIGESSVTVCYVLEPRQCHNGSLEKELELDLDFDALAKQHKDAVYRQMIRLCGNREDAEDVLIEALLKAYRHLDQLRESAAFRAWLAQIAKRVCWQLKEREALLPLLQLSTLEDEGREFPGSEPPIGIGSFSSLACANRETRLLAIEGARSVAPALAALDIRGRRPRVSRIGASDRNRQLFEPGLRKSRNASVGN